MKPYYPAPKLEDKLSGFTPHSGTEEILVEEIEQVEFMQEWTRMLAEGGVTYSTGGSKAVLEDERRLPNFDRRHPGHDRRASKGNDRRGHSPSAGKPSSHSGGDRNGRK